MNGLIIVDKPEGLTSAEVVRRAKRLLRVKTGHLGTLDPFASGILPLCVGDGTKIAQFLNEADKAYEGVIQLGTETDTGDPTGTVVSSVAVPSLSVTDLEQASARFTGEYEQTPPMFSAIKRGGTPLYKLARQGIEVERQPRGVVIENLTLALRDAQSLGFRVSCSKGTYIRVLANDIATFLGTKGYLASLRRTRFGRFNVSHAISLEQLSEEAVKVITLTEALGHLRELRLSDAAAQRARAGFVPLLQTLPSGRSREAIKLVDEAGRLTAVVVGDEKGSWRYARVFP
jgi:tRNA pseudouridine55 synthase